MKSIGDLINEFESLENQTVGEFNRLFTNNKLGKYIYEEDINSYKFEEYPKEWSVEILGVAPNDNRWIILNNQVEIIHELKRDYSHKKIKKGNNKVIKVNGIEYQGVMIASRHFGLSVDQFHRRFEEIEKNKFEIRQGV